MPRRWLPAPSKRRWRETRAAREKAVSSRRRALVGVNNYPNLTEKTPEAAALPPESAEARCRGSGSPSRSNDPRAHHRTRPATGRYPKVLLLKRGDVKMRMARANFCFNFFGCAGFDIVESEEYSGTRRGPDRAVQFRPRVPGIRPGGLSAQ